MCLLSFSFLSFQTHFVGLRYSIHFTLFSRWGGRETCPTFLILRQLWAHPINIGEYWLQPVREDFAFVSYYVAHRYHRERIFEPCGLFSLRFLLEGLINIRLIRVITFRLSVGLRQISCSLKHKLLIFLRTRIIRMTRMSPVGSLACVSCLKFNLHSVDSSHSCSFKTKVLRVSSPSNKDQRS